MRKFIAVVVMAVSFLAFQSAAFAAGGGSTLEQYNTSGDVYVVTVDDLHVRTHPSLEGFVICNLAKGAKVKSMGALKDDDGDDWYYIIMQNGHVGYVISRYVEAAK